PRREVQLVAPHERLGRLALACRAYSVAELRGARERQRVELPRLRGAPEAVERARRVVGRGLSPEERPRVPPELVRDRERENRLAEKGDEPELGRIDETGAVGAVGRAAECRQQPELVEAPPAVDGETDQLAEDSLARGPHGEPCVLARERLGGRLDPEPELVLEPNGPEE